MNRQYTYDSKGKPTGVLIPIHEWKEIVKKYKDLDELAAEKAARGKRVTQEWKDFMEEYSQERQGNAGMQSARMVLDELEKYYSTESEWRL